MQAGIAGTLLISLAVISFHQNKVPLFQADGRASAAYVFPLAINGPHARVADPYANEQDWASNDAIFPTGKYDILTSFS